MNLDQSNSEPNNPIDPKDNKLSHAKKYILPILYFLFGLGAGFWVDNTLNITSNEADEVKTIVDNTNQSASKDSTEEKEVGQAPFNLPDGFSKHEKEDFAYAYPNSWPQPTIKSEAVETAIVGNPYAPSVRYEVSEFASDGGYWVTAEDSPLDNLEEGDYAQFFTPVRRDRSITVYDNSAGDAGCGRISYVFVHNGKVHKIQFPTVCSDNAEGKSYFVSNESDDVEVPDLGVDVYEEVLFSIELEQPSS